MRPIDVHVVVDVTLVYPEKIDSWYTLYNYITIRLLYYRGMYKSSKGPEMLLTCRLTLCRTIFDVGAMFSP